MSWDDWLWVAYALWVIFFLNQNRPLQATLWYYLMKDWQALALFFGRLGLGAEIAYHEAMERYRLA